MKMKVIKLSIVRQMLIDQSGQTLMWVALSGTAMLAVGGMSFDVGHAYVVRSQLQASANAAALAGVKDLYTTVNTKSAASQTLINDAVAYSASSSGANYNAALPTVTTDVSTPCINALMPTTTCAASGNVPNVVREIGRAHV